MTKTLEPELADHNDSVREVAAVIEFVAAGDVQECVVCHILSLTNKIKNYFFFCLFLKVFKVKIAPQLNWGTVGDVFKKSWNIPNDRVHDGWNSQVPGFVMVPFETYLKC